MGYGDDAYWHEASYVYGVTNGINAVADGLRLPLENSDTPAKNPLVKPIEFEEASDRVKDTYSDIMAFYQSEQIPAIFKTLAHDDGYLKDYWEAVRFVFCDGKLDRLTKETLAFTASMAAKSDYGVDFHLSEARRLGLSEKGVMEAVQVVQLFSCYTKMADGLKLSPDFDPMSVVQS